MQNSGKMFSDYKAAVINSYQQKRKEGSLSLNLQQPTPAKLKKECLSVFGVRRSHNDLEILSQFFGHRAEEVAYEAAIRTMDTDKFRPLVNLLIGKVRETEDKNIALLSWIIDFKPRPYRFGYSQTNNGANAEGHKENADTFIIDEKPGTAHLEVEDLNLVSGMGTGGAAKSGNKINYFHEYKKQGIIGLGILFISVLGISFYTSKPQCMYWTGDQYEATACDTKAPNIHPILADDFKLEHFKRITQRDTLTYQDVGKVWYASVDKQIEFYTIPGEDPRLAGRQLRPMSKYIFEKYILPLKTPKVD